MNREEWASVSAYLAAGLNKPMPREQLEVYFDLLGDLPAAAVRAAARQALLEATYPVIPLPGVLRRLAERALESQHRHERVLQARSEQRLRLASFDPEAVRAMLDRRKGERP